MFTDFNSKFIRGRVAEQSEASVLVRLASPIFLVRIPNWEVSCFRFIVIFRLACYFESIFTLQQCCFH